MNATIFGAAHPYDNQSDAIRATDATRVFGLESGKSYSLMLGDHIDGTSDSITGNDFFRANINLNSGSVVSVSFIHEDKNYLLKITARRSSFIQDENATPTVTLHLNPVESFDYVTMKIDAQRPPRL